MDIEDEGLPLLRVESSDITSPRDSKGTRGTSICSQDRSIIKLSLWLSCLPARSLDSHASSLAPGPSIEG